MDWSDSANKIADAMKADGFKPPEIGESIPMAMSKVAAYIEYLRGKIKTYESL